MAQDEATTWAAAGSGSDTAIPDAAPSDPWPLRHLVLRTPRLELCPDDDAGLLELAEQARRGVHPSDLTPFDIPWTDAEPEERAAHVLRWYRAKRVVLVPEAWTVNFLVRHEGRVVGVQEVEALDFAVTREVDTASWLGLEHQGAGIGTEMRQAVVQWSFDHLGATRARSGAFLDNAASLRVSEKLGYRYDGHVVQARHGRPAKKVRLLLTPDTFRRPAWTLSAAGVDACRTMLGAGAFSRG